MTTATFVEPSVCHYPPTTTSAGAEAVDLARLAGLDLDPWQAFVLEHMLAERADGKWAAFEVGLNVPRQNGKGAILEARELAGLFLLGERLVIHSAHEFSTSLEHQRRVEALIEGAPELLRKVRRFKHSHGEESIELMDGRRLRFRTRTRSGGRGLSADCVVLDECMILQETSIGALMPTLSARPNPQIVYAGSAVDQEIMDHGIVWARIRERGLAGEDDSLAYFEWSADLQANPSEVEAEVFTDEERWAAANPALGIRISADHVEKERRSMDPRTFAVERLGIGDWPSTEPGGDAVININDWRKLRDKTSAVLDPVWFAFDVTPTRHASSIGVAGLREDGLVHIEVVDHRQGTGWVAARMAELQRKHGAEAILYDVNSPAASIANEIGATPVNGPDYAAACGTFFDLVADAGLRHLGTNELDLAIRGAAQRPLVDRWAWSRKSSKVDISPLVAVTLAAAQAADVGNQGFIL